MNTPEQSVQWFVTSHVLHSGLLYIRRNIAIAGGNLKAVQSRPDGEESPETSVSHPCDVLSISWFGM